MRKTRFYGTFDQTSALIDAFLASVSFSFVFFFLLSLSLSLFIFFLASAMTFVLSRSNYSIRKASPAGEKYRRLWRKRKKRKRKRNIYWRIGNERHVNVDGLIGQRSQERSPSDREKGFTLWLERASLLFEQNNVFPIELSLVAVTELTLRTESDIKCQLSAK